MNLSDNTAVERDGPEPKVGLFYRWLPFMRWTPSDPVKLQSAEEELLSFLKTPSDGFYVNVGDVHGAPCRLWTRVFTAPNTDQGRDIKGISELLLLQLLLARQGVTLSVCPSGTSLSEADAGLY